MAGRGGKCKGLKAISALRAAHSGVQHRAEASRAAVLRIPRIDCPQDVIFPTLRKTLFAVPAHIRERGRAGGRKRPRRLTKKRRSEIVAKPGMPL